MVWLPLLLPPVPLVASAQPFHACLTIAILSCLSLLFHRISWFEPFRSCKFFHPMLMQQLAGQEPLHMTLGWISTQTERAETGHHMIYLQPALFQTVSFHRLRLDESTCPSPQLSTPAPSTCWIRCPFPEF